MGAISSSVRAVPECGTARVRASVLVSTALRVANLGRSPSRQRSAHGHTHTGKPGPNPKGKAEVQQFYENFAASGAHKLHHDIDRLIVDRDCILTEGVMRMAYPGRTLVAMGVDVDDPDADYLYETRMAIVWPID